MMGCFWVGMLVLSLLSAILTGKSGVLTPAALEGAQSAVGLCLSLGGAMCLWSGLAKVMERAGLTEKLGRILRPIFQKIFPQAGRDSLAAGYLTANVSANLLGLGNAATPMGIAAVKRMQVLSGKTAATDEMCRLVVMNTASIQLLPTTVAALRATHGAAEPFSILPAVWVSSLCSVIVGLLAAALLSRIFPQEAP